MASTAIVTGASRGIGRSVAMELARRGYRTGLISRNAADLAETGEMVQSVGGEALLETVDVTDPAAFERSLTALVESLGPGLDLLVNNAGSALRRARIEDLDDADWYAGIDLNLMAAVRATRHLFAPLKAARGCVVNVSSVVAGRASVTGGPYSAAKAALEAFTRTVALEWARHGIRAIAIAPGYVDTEFNAAMAEKGLTEGFLAKVPTRRAITPDAVARLIGDLGDPTHDQLTGAVIPLDGGLMVGI